MATALTETRLDGVPLFERGRVRDYLEIPERDKTRPAPELPDEIVDNTLDKYREVRDRLLG